MIVVTKMNGTTDFVTADLFYSGTPTIVTYHPSTLLQTNTTHSTKRDLWEDMLRVMEKIGMPISTKQREFFLPKS